MTSVQDRISKIERQQKEFRDSLIRRDERNKKVSKLFYDQLQQERYPFANQLGSATTYESLLADAEDQTDEEVMNIFRQNVAMLLGGETDIATKITNRLTDDGFSIESFSFLNASFDDIKQKMRQQFSSKRANELAITRFFKKYSQTYDADNDGIRDAPEPEQPASAAAAAASATSTQFQKAPENARVEEIKANIIEAIRQDTDLKGVIDLTLQKNNKKGKRTLNSLNTKAELRNLEDFIIDVGLMGSVEAQERYRQKSTERFLPPFKGKGLRPKQKPKRYVGKGVDTNYINDKLYVDIPHLNRGSLCLKYKSTRKIKSAPVAITDKQKNAIMEILKGEYSKKKYDALRSEEKEAIHDFAIESSAKNVDYITDIDKKRMRFEVLLGELRSGNDNKQIIQSLLDSIQDLHKSKIITKTEMLELKLQLEGKLK